MTEIQTIAERAGITMKAVQVDSNPNMDDGSDMDHWRCTLRGQRGSRAIIFSMGRGHHGKPPVMSDVLNCIASDASGADESFEDFCAEFGFDPDSRKAERTWKQVRAQTNKFRAFFGASLFAEMLDAERL